MEDADERPSTAEMLRALDTRVVLLETAMLTSQAELRNVAENVTWIRGREERTEARQADRWDRLTTCAAKFTESPWTKAGGFFAVLSVFVAILAAASGRLPPIDIYGVRIGVFAPTAPSEPLPPPEGP